MEARGSASRREAVNPHTTSSYRMNHSQHHVTEIPTGIYESPHDSSYVERYSMILYKQPASMCCVSKHWSSRAVMKRLSVWLLVPTGRMVTLNLALQQSTRILAKVHRHQQQKNWGGHVQPSGGAIIWMSNCPSLYLYLTRIWGCPFLLHSSPNVTPNRNWSTQMPLLSI